MTYVKNEIWALSLIKAKWAAARGCFLVVAAFGLATGGLGGYVLGPLYTWYMFNDFRFLRYHRLYVPIAVAFWRLAFEWARNPQYRGMFAIPLTAPPMMGPDLSRARVRADWNHLENGCNGCVECCIRRACPLLDLEKNQCRSYGSFFWRYFNCGRYPENNEQIRYYDCPKWECDN